MRIHLTYLPVLLSALLLFAPGCTSSTAKPPAPVEIPAFFSTAGAAPLPQKWWEAFADPDLNRLVEDSLAGNLTLQVAWERLRQAETVARQAGAALRPTLSGDGSAAVGRARTNGETQSGRDFSLGLLARYEVDLWGRVRSVREAAALNAQASAEDLHTAALSLAAQVAATWYTLVEQTGRLELLDLQIATNLSVLELVTLRFRTGQTGIADVLQQRQLIEANRGERTLVQAQAELLAQQLAVLSGHPPGAWRPLRRSTLADLPPLPATNLPAELLHRRPDLRSAWLRVRAADQTVAAAVADRFPRLSLTARADTSSERASDLFSNWLTSLAANLALPLIDGGTRRLEVQRTASVAAESLYAWGQRVLDALAEVENALTQEEGQRRNLASLERQLDLATQVAGRVRDRYLAGNVDYQRVLDTQLSQQQLQRALLGAQAELLRMRIDLCRALAGGWEMTRTTL